MMRFASKSVAALAFVVALAGCGGGSQDTEAPAVGDTPAAIDTAAPTGAPATPTDAASATPLRPRRRARPGPDCDRSPAPTTAAAVEPAAFAVCKACHSVEPGKNGIGPSLAGIYGDKAATVPGYDFSDAMKSSGLTWNQATLDRYLTDPRGVVPEPRWVSAGSPTPQAAGDHRLPQGTVNPCRGRTRPRIRARLVIEQPVAGVLHSLQEDDAPLDPKRSSAGEPLAFDFPLRVAPARSSSARKCAARARCGVSSISASARQRAMWPHRGRGG
jgi:cytochrome c2